MLQQCKIGRLVLVSRAFGVRLAGVTSEHSQISQALHSGLRKPISQRLCMLSISVLVGLMSVIAHHSTLITSRSPRLDCSLALQAQREHSCTHAAEAPKLFLLPLLDLPITSAPSPSCFWAFTVKMCPNTKQQHK